MSFLFPTTSPFQKVKKKRRNISLAAVVDFHCCISQGTIHGVQYCYLLSQALLHFILTTALLANIVPG